VQEAACARTGVYMAARARVQSGEGWLSGVVVPKTARLTLAYCTRGSSSSCTVTLQQSRAVTAATAARDSRAFEARAAGSVSSRAY
jgi:hypothetical protein